MPIGITSPAKNLFLLGTSGSAVVTNFFRQVSPPNNTDHSTSEIIYNTSDKKYLISGKALNSEPDFIGWVEKINEAGTVEWNIEVDSNIVGAGTVINAMTVDELDNIIAVGKTGFSSTDDGYPVIVKYDNDGITSWTATSFTADVNYTGIAYQPTINAYYACGHTEGIHTESVVEKWSFSGTSDWGKRSIFTNRDVVFYDIAVNNRGEVIAVGTIEDDTAYKGYIVKLDANTGDIIWDRTLSSRTNVDESTVNNVDVSIASIIIDNQDDFYVAGSWQPLDDGNLTGPFSEGFLIKYSAEGNIIWQTRTDCNADPSSAINGIYYQDLSIDNITKKITVIGNTYGGDQQILVSRFESNGDLSWRREISEGSNFIPTNVSGDGDQSFVYLVFNDQQQPDKYVYGKVSATGNGLGDFEYDDGTGTPLLQYIPTSTNGNNIGEVIGTISDGSVRNNTSDFVTYPYSANHIVFDDLATQVSNKKAQSDDQDAIQYSGSPSIRPLDFPRLYLDGDEYSGSGEWLDQSTYQETVTIKGNPTYDATNKDWGFSGSEDRFESTFDLSGYSNVSVETWFKVNTLPSPALDTSLGYIWDQSPGASGAAFRIGTDSKLTTFAYPSGGGSVVLTQDPSTVTTGVWYHATTVVSQNSVKLYVNGSLVGTATDPISSIQPIGGTPFTIASSTQGESSVDQIRYTKPGTYSYVVPSGITEISAVCVGAGGGAAGTGFNRGGGGGGGGGLAYGTFAVTPGEVLTIQVGQGGAGGADFNTSGSNGTNSEILRSGIALLIGGGGEGGSAAIEVAGNFNDVSSQGSGGQSSGTERDGGGIGGNGGQAYWNGAGGGGGGTAGYSGNGGQGGTSNNSFGRTNGSGGGGAGGSTSISVVYGGGGTGLDGEGSSGTGNGGGGSFGGSGIATNGNARGGYPGGGGGADDDDLAAPGGPGADGGVRIIWGPSRSYPSTDTSDTVVADNREYFDGEIGELRVYEKALSAREIFQNYNSTKEKYTGVAASTDPDVTSTKTP